jgi:hypothetical protein
MKPLSSVLLRFDPRNRVTRKLRDGLSALALDGDDLWTASDETTSIERLTRVASRAKGGVEYGRHASIDLHRLVQLPIAPGRRGDETDIEALAIHGDDLWIVGSHSVNRAKLDGGSATEHVALLTRLQPVGNRYLLARVPLSALRDEPRATRADRPPARLRGNAKGNDLTRVLRKDPHLGPYMGLPDKENGFDVEGLAVAAGERVFLGLRGPVIGDRALVVELRIDTARRHPRELRLRPVGSASRALYRKHFLDLNGLGIRDLYVDGADLLVLSGPTMKLDGPAVLYRWRGALRARESSVVEGARLQKLFDVPTGEGHDHPEGIAPWPPLPRGSRARARQVLVVYEKPAKRRRGEAHVRADVFRLLPRP